MLNLGGLSEKGNSKRYWEGSFKKSKFDRKRPVIYKKPYVAANLHVMYDVSEKAKE